MVDIFKVELPKDQLDAAPEAERLLYIMLGQITNDLNYMSKLLILVSNAPPREEVEPERQGRSCMARLLLRQFAIALFDGYEIIQKHFSPLFKTYETRLTESGHTNLDNIKRYFGAGTNNVKRIRNKIAAHTDVNHLKEAYAAIPAGETFVEYLSDFRGNCIYYSAELPNLVAMFGITPDGDWRAEVDTIQKELQEVFEWFGDFIQDFMNAFLRQHITPDREKLEDNKVTVETPHSLLEFHIPFFFDRPEMEPE